MTKRLSRGQRQALAVAEHAYAIARARAMTNDEAERAALTRLGPLPLTCARCHEHPPTIFVVSGSGTWICRTCAGG